MSCSLVFIHVLLYCLILCTGIQCARDLSRYHAAEGDSPDRAKTLIKAQHDLYDVVEMSMRTFYSAVGIDKMEILENLVSSAKAVTKRAYPTGTWPDSMEPLPAVRVCMAIMQKENHQLPAALRLSLKGCLYVPRRVGANWVRDLLEVTRIIVEIGNNASSGSIFFGDESFPECSRLRNVARGYLLVLCVDAAKIFGEDVKFVKAIQKWASNYMVMHGEPNVRTKAFESRFKEAQEKLLDWAGMPRAKSIALVQQDAIGSLAEDLDKLKVDA